MYIFTDRTRMKEENAAYLAKHPEIRTLLDELVASILHHKPSDIIKFSSTFFTSLRNPRAAGPPPLVLTGPAGVGKSTLINLLNQRFPEFFGTAINHTSRPPRPGEIDGSHYFFAGKAEMERAIEKGEFIETSIVHTNIYGISNLAIEKIRSQGKICILDISIQGVKTAKLSVLDCRYAFIAPPSLDELSQRIRNRGGDNQESIKAKMDEAVPIMAYGTQEGNFDAIVVNVELEIAFDNLVFHLRRWYPDLDFGENGTV